MRRPLLVVLLLSLSLLAGRDTARDIPVERRHAEPRIVAAELSEGDPAAFASLQRRGPAMTHLLPRWFHLVEPSGKLDDDMSVDTLQQARTANLTIIPVLDNFTGETSRPVAVRRALAVPARRASIVQTVAESLARNNLGGVDVNLVDLTPRDGHLVRALLGELRDALKPAGRVVIASTTVRSADDVALRHLWRLLSRADYIHVAIDDEHNAATAPGPRASAALVDAILAQIGSMVPADRLIVGLPLGGFDWAEQGRTEELSFARAMALANARAGLVTWDAATASQRLTYVEQGISHQAYFEDALTLSNKLRRLEEHQVAGLSWTALGGEDPTIWWRLADGGQPEQLRQLSTVPGSALSYEILGDGEVWDVVGQRRSGHRDVDLNPADGSVAQVRYTQLPSPYVLERSGQSADGNRIALTFDDGPDPVWTPQVLDLLAYYGVPATFFVIGSQVVTYPDLTHRIYAEGHELGNHTFSHLSLNELLPLRAALEFNATRDVVAAATGHTLRYARSPLIGNPAPEDQDSMGELGEFLRPLIRARENNYLTVGAQLDPADFARPSVAEIVARATDRSHTPPGQVILLHDGGGDRSRTLAALPAIIEFYQTAGFQFTTISGLLGQEPEFGMPPVRVEHRLADDVVSMGLQFARSTQSGLAVLLLAGTAITLLRMLFLTVLSVLDWSQRRQPPPEFQQIQPFVSVIIPAFNEERVIAQVLTSILGAHYRNYEIVVVDDGSTDATLAIARSFTTSSQVRVFSQANAGKAEALNLGLARARSDIVVAIDADSVLEPDFLPRILTHFSDPNVAAVAGNVKIANRGDLLGFWQSIEHIVQWNCDRRAYARLNCTTIVPGPAGAWRKRDLLAVGGFSNDTLTEDADTTVSVLRLGRRIVFEDRAIAWTEMPDTLRSFVKQRRRWSFGNLQMLWKHREVLLRPSYGALGFVALPSTMLILTFGLLAPLVDLGALWLSGVHALVALELARGVDRPGADFFWSFFTDDGPGVLFYYSVFLLTEWLLAAVAILMDREDPWTLLWVPVQRLAFRLLYHYILVATFVTALRGIRVGWGKLERKGLVVPASARPAPRRVAYEPAVG